MRVVDETGNKYGDLTVLGRADDIGEKRAMWLCECACGNKAVLRGRSLRYGLAKSCGCGKSLDRAEPLPAPVAGATWIPLGHGKFTLVDSDAPAEVFSRLWFADRKGYAVSNNGHRGATRLHALIAGFKGADHVNHDALDNRRANLRRATNQENCWNQPKTTRPTSSRFKGVHWCSRDRIWKAQIGCDYKKLHLGRFTHERDAAIAYNTAAKRLFGAFAVLNEVPQ